MFSLVENFFNLMAARPAEPTLHDDFVAFCELHGMDARFTLSNQVEGSFIGRHKDFENIQGTVSTYNRFLLDFLTFV